MFLQIVINEVSLIISERYTRHGHKTKTKEPTYKLDICQRLLCDPMANSKITNALPNLVVRLNKAVPDLYKM